MPCPSWSSPILGKRQLSTEAVLRLSAGTLSDLKDWVRSLRAGHPGLCASWRECSEKAPHHTVCWRAFLLFRNLFAAKDGEMWPLTASPCRVESTFSWRSKNAGTSRSSFMMQSRRNSSRKPGWDYPMFCRTPCSFGHESSGPGTGSTVQGAPLPPGQGRNDTRDGEEENEDEEDEPFHQWKKRNQSLPTNRLSR